MLSIIRWTYKNVCTFIKCVRNKNILLCHLFYIKEKLLFEYETSKLKLVSEFKKFSMPKKVIGFSGTDENKPATTWFYFYVKNINF